MDYALVFASFIMIISLFSILFTKRALRVVCILLFVSSLTVLIFYSNRKSNYVFNVVSTFVEEHSEYISSTPLEVIRITPVESLPDGCKVYSVLLVSYDSTYTYSAVLDPEDTEVINFYLEEDISRFENYLNY